MSQNTGTMTPTSSSQGATTFELFPKLAMELQLMIWENTRCVNPARVITVTPTGVKIKGDQSKRVSPLLQACRNSRNTAMKWFARTNLISPWLSGRGRLATPFYVDPEHDIFEFTKLHPDPLILSHRYYFGNPQNPQNHNRLNTLAGFPHSYAHLIKNVSLPFLWSWASFDRGISMTQSDMLNYIFECFPNAERVTVLSGKKGPAGRETSSLALDVHSRGGWGEYVRLLCFLHGREAANFEAITEVADEDRRNEVIQVKNLGRGVFFAERFYWDDLWRLDM